MFGGWCGGFSYRPGNSADEAYSPKWRYVVIQSMLIRNFTVFPEADLRFGSQLNVIAGENGTGKTHLLKLAYCVLSVGAEEHRKSPDALPTKTVLQHKLAEKLVNIFRPEALGRLARRKQGRNRCDVEIQFDDPQRNLSFGFATQSKNEVQVGTLPKIFSDTSPAYLPTRELLTIYPGFVSVYENHYLEFEETWRDTCLLLGAPLKRGPKEAKIRELLQPLEEAMEGSIILDKNGRFYLSTESGTMEMPLVAEGLRKLAMLARLIATGALMDKGYLFWDEPEANLNPRMIKRVAQTIVDLSRNGVQVFVATHSLFLLREIEMLWMQENAHACFIGLHRKGDGVHVEHGETVEDMGELVVLREELEQSDRFLGNGG